MVLGIFGVHVNLAGRRRCVVFNGIFRRPAPRLIQYYWAERDLSNVLQHRRDGILAVGAAVCVRVPEFDSLVNECPVLRCCTYLSRLVVSLWYIEVGGARDAGWLSLCACTRRTLATIRLASSAGAPALASGKLFSGTQFSLSSAVCRWPCQKVHEIFLTPDGRVHAK